MKIACMKCNKKVTKENVKVFFQGNQWVKPYAICKTCTKRKG